MLHYHIMRKLYALCALIMMGAQGLLYAEMKSEASDSLRVEEMTEVLVKAVRVPKYAPFAVSKVDRKELRTFSKSGQELPFLFQRTPGVTAWSENGLGTGTTYMRMRGVGGSRINVTLDGVSLNSPEDQCVFWANMNSYASILGNVQIQRGVGTSVNGDGAFGGTIALTSKAASLSPSMELTASYGSYNTYNVGGNFSSGLLKNHWMLDGAYHHTGTDGFVHGTEGNSGSYYAGITYMNDLGTLKVSYKNVGNYERTGQAWNGVTAGNDDYSMNVYDGIKTYEDMYKAGLGKYNSLYEAFVPDWNGGWTLERHTMRDGQLWERTTDNFWQNHILLSVAYRVSEHWSTAGTLRYTRGHGYYDEFRPNNKLSKFGLTYTQADGTPLKRTDFVRQKGLTQDTYGMNWNANYQNEKWDVIGGTSFQNFEGTHYGYLTYAKDEGLEKAIMKNGKYRYYDSAAAKSDVSLFLKGTYHLTDNWDAYADLQYRHVGFLTNGINDKFVGNADGTYSNQLLNVDKKYDFLNPKVGVSYHRGGHNAYVSYALSHREPERNNFTDNGSYPAPKAESLNDIEVGYSYNGTVWHAGVGLYAMLYRDQFVQTGAVSDIGEALTTNIRNSHRLGVELSGGVNVTDWFSLEGNAVLSSNRIKDFDEVVETYDDDWNDMPATMVHYDNSTLAFSPTAIVNGFADFHVKGFQATWHTNFVSRQYLDNSECKDRSLPKYSQTNVRLSYELKCCRRGLKSTVFGLNLNNIFDRHYAAAGWVYSSIVGTAHPESNRYYQIGYIPMAGFTMMGNVTLNF